jgi:AraC-like DNA-binding protein
MTSAPQASAIPRIEGDLKPSADGSSFTAYRDISAALTAISLPPGASAADFWVKTASYQLPDTLIFRVSSAAQVMHRGPEQIAFGADQFMISAQVEGHVNGRCGDRPVSVGPGDIAIYDEARGYDTQTSDFTILALFVARARMPPLFLAPAAHGAVIPAASGAARLLYRGFETLFDTAGSLTIAQADAAVDAVIGMLAAALQPWLASPSAHRSGDAAVDKAMDHIDAHISDADLAPADFAKPLGLSRSALYRAFEPLGGVRAVILRRRLDRSMKAIVTGGGGAKPLRDVWLAHGFRTETHFNRAFRGRFGLTPRAFHDMIGRKDYAGLSAQAQRAGFTTFQAWIDHVSRTDTGSAG